MSAEVLEILEPGLITTVQDRGRYGYQRFGVPVSGAMDLFALRVANILVGNDEGSACLEMTALGPKVRFLNDSLISITGADLTPVIDGEPYASLAVGRGWERQCARFRGWPGGLVLLSCNCGRHRCSRNNGQPVYLPKRGHRRGWKVEG